MDDISIFGYIGLGFSFFPPSLPWHHSCRDHHQTQLPTASSHGLFSRHLLTASSHGFFSRLLLTASAHGFCSRLLLTASSHGFFSRLLLTASSHGFCSRLLLTASSLDTSSLDASSLGTSSLGTSSLGTSSGGTSSAQSTFNWLGILITGMFTPSRFSSGPGDFSRYRACFFFFSNYTRTSRFGKSSWAEAK
jgi:hypothetical protein